MVISATECAGHGTALVKIVPGGLDEPSVRELLEHHVRTVQEATAVGSAHALDLEALKSTDVSFWSAWHDTQLVGVGALKQISPAHGEIKWVQIPDRSHAASRSC